VLPKVESATALATIDWLLTQLERKRDLAPGAIDLIPIIETAGGLTNLDGILAAGTRVRQVAFGAGDFTLDVNMAWSRTEAELGFARARIATASRAAGIAAPLDTVWVDLADEEGLEMSARTALGFGFQGKMCIHPKQIAPVHRVFTPGEAEVAFAERVVAAFAEAEAAGSAAIQLDGKFIDYPILYRRAVFLAEMERVVPWPALCGLIEPFYPKAGNGRPPVGVERMLRIYFLQQWFNLSDPAVEEALYDSLAMRDFIGIDLGREPVPDETTVCRFRHLLETHDLGQQLFDEVQRHLTATGLKVATGTIVDATIISAPSSTKNAKKARDREMHQTKKGNQWYFGMKGHIGIDSRTS
jgi:transposase-like protein DUF772/HpcH/HpaI aldolase/citrate lyase family protein